MAGVVQHLAAITSIVNKYTVGHHGFHVNAADGESMHILEVDSAGPSPGKRCARKTNGLHAEVRIGHVSVADEVNRFDHRQHGTLPYNASVIAEQDSMGNLVCAVLNAQRVGWTHNHLCAPCGPAPCSDLDNAVLVRGFV